MAMAAQSWEGVEPYINGLGRHTVPVLREFAEQIDRAVGKYVVSLRSTDKKADVVHKIGCALKGLRDKGNVAAWRTIRAYIDMRSGQDVYHRYGGVPAPPRVPAQVPAPPAPTFGGVVYGRPAANGQYNYASGSTYRPAQPASRPPPAMLDWRATPMWRPVRALTHLEPLPLIHASEQSTSRRDARTVFMMTPSDVQLLSQNHSIRLFITSNLHYSPGDAHSRDSYHITNRAIPMDYPVTPEVLVDNLPVMIKDKGLRGKAGSAPPLDLNTHNRLGTPKSVQLMVRHSGPSLNPKKKDEAKRFWFQVVLVEWTSKEQLLAQIDALPVMSAADSLALTQCARGDDDDIEMEKATMTLKDPLSFMRMTRPIRSRKCRHQQCFDATWWIETNYTHPQWLCPNCGKELNFADLIMDGYTIDIQNAVGDDIDEVVIEGDGEWHTENGKLGSAAWLAANGPTPSSTKPHTPTPAPVPAPAPVSELADASAPSLSTTPPEIKGKRKMIQILSSDDEDDTAPLRAKRPSLAPGGGSYMSANGNGTATGSATPQPQSSVAGPSRPSVPRQTSDVIDLTLSDSDDDDDHRPPPRTPSVAAGTSTASVNGNANETPNFQHPGAGLGRFADGSSLPLPRASSPRTRIHLDRANPPPPPPHAHPHPHPHGPLSAPQHGLPPAPTSTYRPAATAGTATTTSGSALARGVGVGGTAAAAAAGTKGNGNGGSLVARVNGGGGGGGGGADGDGIGTGSRRSLEDEWPGLFDSGYEEGGDGDLLPASPGGAAFPRLVRDASSEGTEEWYGGDL